MSSWTEQPDAFPGCVVKDLSTANKFELRRLDHTGCRITSIQAFLGHKKLNTTLIYARAYDQTVADDYYAAMSRVEQRLEIVPAPTEELEVHDEVVKVQEPAKILSWIDLLALPELTHVERQEIAEQLKTALHLDTIQALSPKEDRSPLRSEPSACSPSTGQKINLFSAPFY